MKKYIEVAKILFKTQLIYRFDVAMTALETIGRVLFAWLIWGAVFAGRNTVKGFYFEAMLLYYVVSSFISTLDLSWNVSGEVSQGIRGGTFSKFMVIPANPLAHFLAQNFGAASYYALFALPVAFISGIMFGARACIGNPAAVILGLTMIPIGTAFMVMYHFFIGLLAFKFQDVTFFRYMQSTVINFIQGGYLPLNLLSDNALSLIRLLPFPHTVFTPAMLIIGRMDFYDGLFSMGVLAFWTTAMLAVTQLAYKRLRVKYDGVGV